MKILVCGDKHLKVSRLEAGKKLLTWLSEQIKTFMPDLVVALGDDMDDHAVLRSEVLSEYRKHVDYVVRELNIPMVYVVGNHDYHKPGSTTYHALETFKGLYSNLHIVDSHVKLYDMDFVPHIFDHTKFPVVSSSICFAHQTFIGADYGYIRPDVGVDASKLQCDLIISGHIHKRQQFGNVIYPGSPMANSMHDIDQTKGIILLDTETLKHDFIRSPFPIWRNIEITIDGNLDSMSSFLQSQLNSTDNWVITVTGLKAEIAAYLQSKSFTSIVNGKSFSIKTVVTDSAKNQLVKIKSINLKDIVMEWMDKVYNGFIPKEDIKHILQSIITEVDGN